MPIVEPIREIWSVGAMRSRLLAAAAWLCACAIAAASFVATPASAEDTDPVVMTYEVYFGGLHVLSAEAELDRTDRRYRLVAQGETQGILDFFFSWRGNTESIGKFEAGGPVPARHRNHGYREDRVRKVALAYDGSGDVAAVLVEPPPDLEEVNALPDDAEIGTMDPLSVIAGLSESLTQGAACSGVFQVFDGRRRYDLTVTDKGTQNFEANDYSVFQGEARACGIEYELLGGDRKEKSKYVKTAHDRVVYVGRPLDEAPAIPVRAKIETDYGTVMAHLTSIAAGGKQLALKND
ncbi:DUF3108 domain-containing protein [Hwanghaeella grinnelliae]|uniref:DUF3108 domain-containing protein n=2 Tax=Hwanghaeella grinnelliae TaxID=2500179 RepID=A0A3S2ZAX9_9PROT|nr:DUF3108 domain-containing protein [Hwanghaeella grinnelliae]